MSAAPQAEHSEEPKKGGGKKKILLLLLPLVLGGAGAGLWFTGILPGLLGMGGHEEQHAEGEGQPAEPPGPRPPAYFDMPEIITNLNATGRRPVFVKLRSKLEITREEDGPTIQQAMPRLLDLFQTYLRETRPEELRGSAGMQRLREELVARANIAVTPPAGSNQAAPQIRDVLFTEVLIQ